MRAVAACFGLGARERFQLLATKLRVPPRRAQLVPRSRLWALLDQGLSRSVTLVCAPAGSGKTTLVADWIRGLSGDRPAAAWLSLDEGDGDLATFIAYLLASLQRVTPGIGRATESLLQSLQPPEPRRLMTVLLNEMEGSGVSAIVVLDDYHTLNNPAIDAALAFLVDQDP